MLSFYCIEGLEMLSLNRDIYIVLNYIVGKIFDDCIYFGTVFCSLYRIHQCEIYRFYSYKIKLLRY